MSNIDTFMKLKSVTPGIYILSKNFGYLTLPGTSNTLNSISDTKRATEVFGWRDDTQPEPPPYKPTAPYLATQATNYVKSVKLLGFIGNSQVSEEQVWLRVFREIYYPSVDPNYIKRIKDQGFTRANPTLPSIGMGGITAEGMGSLYAINTGVFPSGQYQVLWLRWGSGGGTENGVLFDYYYTGTSSLATTPSLDASPTASQGYSRSGSATFRTSPLSTHSNSGIAGYYMGMIEGDTSGAKYFLRDDPQNPNPILQSSKSLTVNKPNIITSAATTFSADSLGLFTNADLSTIVPLGTTPGGATPFANLRFSSIVLKENGKSYVIAVTDSIRGDIDIHIANASAIAPVNFSSSGGKAIVGTGANQNYIGPNLEFRDTPNSDNAWDVIRMSSNEYTRAVIVDGTAFTEIANNTLESRDNDWIAGYAPSANTTTAIYAARDNYYYILPAQVRTKGTGQCMCTTAVESSPTSQFTSPTSPCTTGFHWGKFLKSSVNGSRGFTTGQLAEYVGNINNQAKNFVTNNLVASKFQGMIVTSAGQGSANARQLTFSLRDVIGVQQGTSSSFPKSTSTTIGGEQTTIGTDADQTGANVTTEKQWTGPPRDWKKTITEATDRLLSGQTVDQMTPARLSKFLSAQVALGAPLAQLKESVLASILAAKLVALQSQGKTRKVALAELKDDPVYQSLVLAINATKAATKDSSSNSSASGATNPGGDEKNTKTIRISVVRGLPGYRSGARPTASIVGQPELVQTYESYGEDGIVVGSALPRRFVFPFVPKEVTYSGIGTQWTEIARSGNYPIVDWTGFNLLKISFNFDIVDTQYKGQMGFGLSYSCEESITTLRQMAQTPYPVTFLNMDKFMTDEVRWPLLTTGRGIEFVISEFSVTAVQRTGGTTTDKSAPNQISRATCSMTLQEIPIETVNIVQMPPIKPCKKNCQGDKIPPGDKVKQYLLYTSGS